MAPMTLPPRGAVFAFLEEEVSRVRSPHHPSVITARQQPRANKGLLTVIFGVWCLLAGSQESLPDKGHLSSPQRHKHLDHLCPLGIQVQMGNMVWDMQGPIVLPSFPAHRASCTCMLSHTQPYTHKRVHACSHTDTLSHTHIYTHAHPRYVQDRNSCSTCYPCLPFCFQN